MEKFTEYSKFNDIARCNGLPLTTQWWTEVICAFF